MTETEVKDVMEQAQALLEGRTEHVTDTIDSIMDRLFHQIAIRTNDATFFDEISERRETRLQSLATTMLIAGFSEAAARSSYSAIKTHGLMAGSRKDVTARFLAEPGALGIFSQKLSQTPEKFAAYIAACCHWQFGAGIGLITPSGFEDSAPMSFSPLKVGVLVISNASSAIGYSIKKIVSLVTSRILSGKRTIVTSYGDTHDNELVEHLRSSLGVIEI